MVNEWGINTGVKGKLMKSMLVCGVGVLLWITVTSGGDTL